MTPACPVVRSIFPPGRWYIKLSLKMINEPHVFTTAAKKSRNLPRILISKEAAVDLSQVT